MFSISPDGNRLAVSYTKLESEIWIFNLVDGRRSRLTNERYKYAPSWFPDNQRVLFKSYPEGKSEIYAKTLNKDDAVLQFDLSSQASYACVSLNGRWMDIQVYNKETLSDIWLKDLSGTAEAKLFRNHPIEIKIFKLKL